MVCIGRKRQRDDDELDAPQKDDRKQVAQDIQCVCVCVCVCVCSMQRAAEIQQQNMQQRHRRAER